MSKHSHTHIQQSYFTTSKYLFTIWIASIIIFAIAFSMHDGKSEYDKANAQTPSIKLMGLDTQAPWDIVTGYGIWIGIGLVAVVMIVVLFALRFLGFITTLNRFPLTSHIITIIAAIVLIAFGAQLLFNEPRFTTWGNAIIFGLGSPIMWTGIFTALGVIATAIISHLVGRKHHE